MKIIKTTIMALALGATLSVAAQDPWLHIYSPKGSNFSQFKMSDVFEITFNETNGTMNVNSAEDGDKYFYQEKVEKFVIGPNTPSIKMTTDSFITEVFSKVIYMPGKLKFEGMGMWDDFEAPVKLRGRGNSTWSSIKKPYRLKFEEKLKLGSLKKAKNYVLLANYIDQSVMKNFVAFKIEELIGMPYPNHVMPVNVWLNDIYKGTYMATEKVGFNNGSVDIPAEQEARSVMFELDSNPATEDELAFDSDNFNDYSYIGYLPVRIKDPDAPEDELECEAWCQKWQDDFNNFIGVVSRGNASEIFAACDVESLAKFILVFNVCCNQELNHPKSVFLYKTEGEKYFFGPCWDFDWAFGYQPTYTVENMGNMWDPNPSYQNPLLGTGQHDGYHGDGDGGLFFYMLCNNTTFLKKYKEVWRDFYKNKQSEFWAAFDEYVEQVRPSVNLDGAMLYSKYQGFDDHVAELREWVKNRIEFINSDPYYGLWNDNYDFDY